MLVDCDGRAATNILTSRRGLATDQAPNSLASEILSADALIGSDASESDLLDGILTACLERVARPEPNWEAGGAPEGQ